MINRSSYLSIAIIIFLEIISIVDGKIDNIYTNDSGVFRRRHNDSDLDSDVIVGRQNPFLEWIAGIIGGKPPLPPTRPPSTTVPVKICKSCVCGITNKETRIVGGYETQVNQYPWMGMLLYSGRFYCGATLINDRYVLTAAHCVSGFNSNHITVRLLEHNRVNSNPNKIDRKVMKVIRHAQYQSSTFNNDIALLQLDKIVEFRGLLRPVCLPTPGKSFNGETGIVTGWGAVKEGGSTSEYLQEVSVRIMSNQECGKTNYGPNRITENMMCAGEMEGGKDSCQGDSGGPLHVVKGNTHMIGGVVSWGEGCAQRNAPGVYTRVNRYGTWIKSNTRDACYCPE